MDSTMQLRAITALPVVLLRAGGTTLRRGLRQLPAGGRVSSDWLRRDTRACRRPHRIANQRTKAESRMKTG